MIRSRNGITLIALVITIIVLLILAGVTLSLTLGENGILRKGMEAKEENRGATVDEKVKFWKTDLKLSKTQKQPLKSTQSIVNELFEEGLITEEEKYIILGDESKEIEGAYEITIGSKHIDFFTDEYRDGTPGLYVTRTNILKKSWDELLEEGYITVENNEITSCQKNQKGDLIIPEEIVKIKEDAFNGYKKLTYIDTNKVTEIERRAFSGCTGLTELTINESIKNIGDLAFSNCTGLKKIKVRSSDFSINAYSGSGLDTFKGSNNIEEIIYEEGVTSIVGIGCKFVNKITLPNTITKIEMNAFSNYTNLTSITIPASITRIGNNAFANCTGLTYIDTNKVTNIGQAAFSGCTGLTELTINESIKNIGNKAFSNCTGLKKIKVRSSDFTININPGSALDTFRGSTNIEEIIYEEGVTDIVGIGCTSATKITFPSTVKIIKTNAFSGYTNLTSITIPDSITQIGNSAFANCTGLTYIDTNKVTDIGHAAFSGCTGLTELTIKEFIKNIGGLAFSNCTGLKKIKVSSSNFSINTNPGSALDTFRGSTNIEEIIYEEGVTDIVGIGCTSATKITFPSTVKIIKTNAFSGYTNLTSITIPNSITQIGNNAFRDVPHIYYSGTATGSPWGALAIN